MCAGSELVIGPWSHSGFLDNRVGHSRSGHRSKFNHLTHTLTFFDRCCGRHTPDQALAEVAAHEAGATHPLGNGGAPLAACANDRAGSATRHPTGSLPASMRDIDAAD